MARLRDRERGERCGLEASRGYEESIGLSLSSVIGRVGGSNRFACATKFISHSPSLFPDFLSARRCSRDLFEEKLHSVRN